MDCEYTCIHTPNGKPCTPQHTISPSPDCPAYPSQPHSTITSAGLASAIESRSEGVGEQRQLSIYKKGAAPAKWVEGWVEGSVEGWGW